MPADWGYVKRSSLWHYEALVKKLRVLPAYPVLWQAYNHNMEQAAEFARRLLRDGTLSAGRDLPALLETMGRLRDIGVKDWGDLLSRVSTRQGFLDFVTQNGLGFKQVIDILVYLLRWGFPFQTASRELLAHDSLQEMDYYELLRLHRFMYSFDLLQAGYTLQGRSSLARKCGLPPEFAAALVHRADIARLPFVRRKTILILCGAGFNTLAGIAGATPAGMSSCLDAYLSHAYGKSMQEYRAVILPASLIAAARVLPVIVEQPSLQGVPHV